MTATAIEFPVLEFSQGMVLAETTEEGLTTCSSRGLKNGWFDKLLVIDSARRAYRVREVRKVGYANAFLGFSLMYGRRYRIELEFHPPKNLSMDEVRERTLAAFKRNLDFWEAGYSWEELQEKVAEADTVMDLVALMT